MEKKVKENERIQLCKVGDRLYRVSKAKQSDELYVEPITITVSEFILIKGTLGHWYYRDDKKHSYFNRNIGKNCFKTEEAKKEILRRHHMSLKRRLLKNYEKKLNEVFEIGDHYIIK